MRDHTFRRKLPYIVSNTKFQKEFCVLRSKQKANEAVCFISLLMETRAYLFFWVRWFDICFPVFRCSKRSFLHKSLSSREPFQKENWLKKHEKMDKMQRVRLLKFSSPLVQTSQWSPTMQFCVRAPLGWAVSYFLNAFIRDVLLNCWNMVLHDRNRINDMIFQSGKN